MLRRCWTIEKISIIIPCYNENHIIGHTLSRVGYSFQGLDYELVVVDDGSQDFTRAKIAEAKRIDPHINPIIHYHNMGKGRAVYNGLLNSKYPLKLVLDADLSVSPTQYFEDVIQKFDWPRYFIIKGDRVQVISQPWYRLAVGKAWKALVWLKTGLYMDTQCPFWLMRLPKRFYQNMRINGFAFDVEILLKAKKQGIPIYVVQVPYCNGLKTSVTLKKTMRMAIDLFSL